MASTGKVPLETGTFFRLHSGPLKGPLIKIFRVHNNNIVFWLTSLPVILSSPNIIQQLHSKGLEKGYSVLK